MESGENVDICLSGGATGGSRWNPTKEQIDMLEGLYRQGLRTPSADQIQQITNRLRVFGHIEGKNVFYWFQNHKARQRQKQKQQNFTYFNRLLHKTSVFPPCPNVVCSPVYIPYPDHVGLYHHHQPKVLLPRGLKRKPMVEKMEAPKMCTRPNIAHDQLLYQHQSCMGDVGEGLMNEMKNFNGHQTLDLFPLQPSGNLQSKNSMDFDTSGNNYAATPSTSSSADIKCFSDQQFFDFFRENGHCQSH